MNVEQKIKQSKIITDLISRYESQRAFARAINEDPADVIKWRNATIAVKPRVVMTLARLFNIHPNELRPDLFDADIQFIFGSKK